MKKDELISMWEEENSELYRNQKTDRNMITQYLNEKTLKGSRNMKFSLIFYGIIQLANIVLISMNLTGYANNQAMIWALIAQLVLSIAILVFSMDMFYRLREINNYSESLIQLINKQLYFYKRPFEIWQVLAALSAIILITNINLFIDNDNGSYVIYHKLRYALVTLGVFLFIYVSQKMSSTLGLRNLKAYLSDLQAGSLDQSQSLEHKRKRYLYLWIALFVLLTASLVFGLIKALS